MGPTGDTSAVATQAPDSGSVGDLGSVDPQVQEVAVLTDLFAQAIADDPRFSDVFIVDLVVRGHKGTRVVEAFVDGDESVTIDRIASVSRMLGSYLDQHPDLIKGAFRLEVSSPGPKRSLLVPRQYQKHVGRTLSLRCDHDSGKRTTGVLASVDEDGVTLDVDGRQETIKYNQILEGKVALPW